MPGAYRRGGCRSGSLRGGRARSDVGAGIDSGRGSGGDEGGQQLYEEVREPLSVLCWLFATVQIGRMVLQGLVRTR